MQNQKGNGIIFGILIGLLLAGGLFAAYYLGAQSHSEDQKPAITQTNNTSPDSQSSSAPPADSNKEVTNWKTYEDEELSFKYPQGWNASEGPFVEITSDVPKVRIITAGSGLMNECMERVREEEKNGLFIIRFNRFTTGEMCKTDDSTPREVWVVSSKESYGPGISYSYSSSEPAAEEILNQIISTFKFKN